MHLNVTSDNTKVTCDIHKFQACLRRGNLTVLSKYYMLTDNRDAKWN